MYSSCIQLKKNSPDLIHVLVNIASMIVSAIIEDRTSLHRCQDCENKHSTEMLVPGMAKKSRAIHAIIGNFDSCVYT